VNVSPSGFAGSFENARLVIVPVKKPGTLKFVTSGPATSVPATGSGSPNAGKCVPPGSSGAAELEI
jgi:hypothetical protein